MTDERKFQIYRAADAPGLMASHCMSVTPGTAEQRAGMDQLIAAGFLEGDQIKVLVNMGGFSLTHVWFKKDYPLPLHSHDADCLYYIIAGSLELGSETLGPKDCFFIPADAAYAYRPGPDGVELLEFRHATQFEFRNLAKSPAFYAKAAALIAANREHWAHAVPPSAKSP
jgi:mannose-6-phosphate isomerase-like protein (cupin superfamily)